MIALVAALLASMISWRPTPAYVPPPREVVAPFPTPKYDIYPAGGLYLCQPRDSSKADCNVLPPGSLIAIPRVDPTPRPPRQDG